MSPPNPPASLHCTRCDDLLPPGFQEGLCPVCLMDMAMRPTHDDTLPVAPPQKPLTPEELAPHFPQLEILECIGRGGMGVVYKARQKTLDRLVALKLLAPEQTKDAAFAGRFAHEARALAALSHPNIVTIHDFGETGGFFYLLMEFVDGVNLRQAMRGSHLSPEQALAIVPPICEALQYAHEHGIVHRDIKPENLLLDKAGRVKIADFGIAKMMGREKTAAEDEAQGGGTAGPRHTVVGGTPEYMAPEQRNASAKADHRADIYSLGVVLYEVLTGKRPPSPLEIPLHDASTHTLLDEVVRRALAEDPEQRYQTVAELQQHLATLTKTTAAAPQVWLREAYQHWLVRALRAAGWLWMMYGVGRLMAPGATFGRLPFVLPPSPATMLRGLPGAVLIWLAASVLIRWRAPLARASYRPLIVPPSRFTEVAAFAVRLYALWLAVSSFTGMTDFVSVMQPILRIGDALLLLLSVCLFFFEHVFSPIFHAVPAWKPLPFPETSTRRTLCGHAVAGAVLLGLLLWLIVELVDMYQGRMADLVEWEKSRMEEIFSALVRVFWISAIVSVVGWAAVGRIRHSGGRLYGMAAASAAAFALPVSLVFAGGLFLTYIPLSRRQETHAYLPDGTVQTTLPPQPELLVQVAVGAAVVCLLCWVGICLKVRRLPRPAPVVLPARRLGLLTAPLWFLVFASPVTMMTALSVRGLPRAAIPEQQFPRYVERQLNLQLYAAGYRHDLPQYSLKLPSLGWGQMLSLPGLRDAQGRDVKGRLHLSSLRGVRTDSLQIRGQDQLAKISLMIDRIPRFPLLREITIATPAASRHCLWYLRRDWAQSAPEDLQKNLQSGPAALTAADFAWLDEQSVDLVPHPNEEGALLLLGGAVLVTEKAPADFSWLTLDDRQVAAALAKAREIRDARPADQRFTVVRERSPALVAFVTRRCSGLLENLGPSKPGARDVRLRVHVFDHSPFR